MGAGLYLKNYRGKDGRTQLEIRVRHKKLQYVKTLDIRVHPKDWDAKNLRIKGGLPQVNAKLSDLREGMLDAWDMYEANIYTWEELIRRVNGGSKKVDVESFIEDVYKYEKTQSTYITYKNCISAYKAILGYKSIQFTDVNYSNITSAINKWKTKGLSPSSINTYVTHIGSVVNEAHRRGLAPEAFIKHKTYRQKITTRVIKTVTTEDMLNAIPRVKDIYDFQTLSLWLLQFSLRGLYVKDIAQMYKHDKLNEDDYDKDRYVLHKRSKTGEPMHILYSCEPTEDILLALKNSFKITHPTKCSNTMNALELLIYDTEDVRVHKNVWDVYQKRCTKILGYSFKTARKTFESTAMLLDVSSPIRYKLLGHVDSSIKRNYLNWEWDKLSVKVDDAHKAVIDSFNTEAIWNELSTHALVTGLVTEDTLSTIHLSND